MFSSLLSPLLCLHPLLSSALFLFFSVLFPFSLFSIHLLYPILLLSFPLLSWTGGQVHSVSLPISTTTASFLSHGQAQQPIADPGNPFTQPLCVCLCRSVPANKRTCSSSPGTLSSDLFCGSIS